jgi:hypothetical protein
MAPYIAYRRGEVTSIYTHFYRPILPTPPKLERDEAQAQTRHWRESAVTENERAMESLNAALEAQAHAADLRGALEAQPSTLFSFRSDGELLCLTKECTRHFPAGSTVAKVGHAPNCPDGIKQAALARTPAQSLGRLKAEILQEAADSVPPEASAHDWFYMLASKHKAESEQHEAANG